MADLSRTALSPQCVDNCFFQAGYGLMAHIDQDREIGVAVLEVEISPPRGLHVRMQVHDHHDQAGKKPA